MKATLPGVAADDISISVTGDVPTIGDEVKTGREAAPANCQVCEKRDGAFSHSLTLPASVKADKAEAKSDNETSS